MKTTPDDFERIALGDKSPFGPEGLPASARQALQTMRQIIRESESPADVTLAIAVGLGYCLVSARDSEDILKAVIGTAMKVQEAVEALVEANKKGN